MHASWFTLETLLGAIERGAMAGRDRVACTSAQPVADRDDPVPPPASGESCPVAFDDGMSDTTASLLDRQTTQHCLVGLAYRVEAPKQRRVARDGNPARVAALADAAHVIAGTAVMFGFARLV